MTDAELNAWERQPNVLSILTSKEFGEWLYRRDKNKEKHDLGNMSNMDLIRRQDAIDKFESWLEVKGYSEGEQNIIKVVLYELENLPSAELWIPCSERLPKNIKPVIVTWKNTDPKSYYQYIVGKHFIGTAHYKNGKWYWYSSVTEDLLAEYGKCDSEEFDEAIEVVAWMPLPDPWEGDQS